MNRPVGKAIYAIDAFPDDAQLWRIDWIGGVAYNGSVPSEPLIDVCLARLQREIAFQMKAPPVCLSIPNGLHTWLKHLIESLQFSCEIGRILCLNTVLQQKVDPQSVSEFKDPALECVPGLSLRLRR
jgi:hypothetical protein